MQPNIKYQYLSVGLITVDSYGFRAFLPVQFILIGVSFISVDKLILKTRVNYK
jgi:hypothetical protein